MAFKTTNITKTRRAAFTLVEMMVAVGISSMVLLGIGSFSCYSGRSFAAMSNYVDLDRKSRNALDRMSRDIRQSNFLSSYSTNISGLIQTIVLNDYDGVNLTYAYNPAAKTLTRTKAGNSNTLLSECDTFSFGVFQRTPKGGTYEQFPTGSSSTCKVIQLNWICSRKIFGSKVNTESVQSAKIVIRKK